MPPSARPTCTSQYCVLACGELVGGDCDTPNTGAQCYDIQGLGVGVCLHPNLGQAAPLLRISCHYLAAFLITITPKTGEFWANLADLGAHLL